MHHPPLRWGEGEGEGGLGRAAMEGREGDQRERRGGGVEEKRDAWCVRLCVEV